MVHLKERLFSRKALDIRYLVNRFSTNQVLKHLSQDLLNCLELIITLEDLLSTLNLKQGFLDLLLKIKVSNGLLTFL